MAVARLSVSPPAPTHVAARRTSPTRSSSTSARTRRCCAPAARRACACSSPRTGDGLVAAPAGRAATRSTSARSSTPSGACPTTMVADQDRRHGPGRGALPPRAGIGPLEQWEAVEAPARRRRWYDSGDEVLAVLLASESDVDDLVPTLVAYQIEWNKIRRRMLRRRLAAERGRRRPRRARRRSAAPPTTGRAWRDAWGDALRGAPAGDRRRAASRCACACSAAPRSATSA